MSRLMQHRLAAQKRRAGGTQDFQTDREVKVEQPGTDDVRVAAKTAGTFKSRYVTLVQTPKNRLEIIPDPAAIHEFIDDNSHHLPDDIMNTIDPTEEKYGRGTRMHLWGDHQVLHELLDQALGNGWTWVQPEDIGALTDGEILEAPDGRIYWHERYQIESSSEELLQGKTVTFDGAPENRMPTAPDAKEAAFKDLFRPTPQPDEKKEEEKGKEAAAKKADVDGASMPPAAHTPPAPAATTGGNPYQDWKSENLIETIEGLTDSESFAKDKPEQKAVEMMAEVLSARPVESAPAEEAKKAALKRAKKAAAITAFPPSNDETGTVLEGDKSLPEGHDFQENNSGVEAPKEDTPSKFAGINDPAETGDTSSILEGDKSIPEGKDDEENNTGVDVLSEDGPSKFAGKKAAAPITTAKALTLIEDLCEELKGLYMDAKPITTVNESRPVREGVEAIYHAMKKLGEAQKIVAKQKKQEDDEAEAAEKAAAAKPKKSAFLSMANLNIVAAEDEDMGDEGADDSKMAAVKTALYATAEQARTRAQQMADESGSSVLVYKALHNKSKEQYGAAFTLPHFGERVGNRIEPKQKNASVSRIATVSARSAFRARVAKVAKVDAVVANELSDSIMRTAAAYRAAKTETKKAELETKLTVLAGQLGLTININPEDLQVVSLNVDQAEAMPPAVPGISPAPLPGIDPIGGIDPLDPMEPAVPEMAMEDPIVVPTA